MKKLDAKLTKLTPQKYQAPTMTYLGRFEQHTQQLVSSCTGPGCSGRLFRDTPLDIGVFE